VQENAAHFLTTGGMHNEKLRETEADAVREALQEIEHGGP